jgi:glycerol-3-phosphate dehydrogenase (NAD(P)+)
MRCAVVGAGAWGTALADLLARNGHTVVMWAHEPEVVASIAERHENEGFLRGFALSPSLQATTDLSSALDGAEIVVFATPSAHLRALARRSREHVRVSAAIAVASKGIEAETLALMTDVVEEELPARAVVAISGPSFAAEVAAGEPTAIVAASCSTPAAVLVQEVLSSQVFRVYTHDDVRGVELGGSLKNVMAVATGICEGLGLGFNARAALITRGLAEMTRLGVALGARAHTFAGLAGMGDLVLTCTGALSRNRAIGLEIGKGRTLQEALAGKQTVAEGVHTTRSARALAERAGVEMPIIRAVSRILFEGQAPRDGITQLMTRELRPEQDQ